ncbi:plastid ACC-1 [Artemisia annua]|uniref:Plastid ACC-1 n=1 Tax=Artemisia annua TaxID=35608 RepID=A0A2U1KQE7_ARTAN|nr:plastid ACC-1 [Artemisia annua]
MAAAVFMAAKTKVLRGVWVLLKVSGEALVGDREQNIDQKRGLPTLGNKVCKIVESALACAGIRLSERTKFTVVMMLQGSLSLHGNNKLLPFMLQWLLQERLPDVTRFGIEWIRFFPQVPRPFFFSTGTKQRSYGSWSEDLEHITKDFHVVDHPVTECIAEINQLASQVAVGMGIPLWQISGRLYGMDNSGGYDG